MDKTALKETIRISGKRRFTELWMMNRLEKSSRKCLKLYKESLLTTSGITVTHQYKEYRNMLNKARHAAMKSYYNSKSIEYKHQTKKLWQLLNQTVNRCKGRGSIIPYITIDGKCTYDPKKIANNFGKFY